VGRFSLLAKEVGTGVEWQSMSETWSGESTENLPENVHRLPARPRHTLSACGPFEWR